MTFFGLHLPKRTVNGFILGFAVAVLALSLLLAPHASVAATQYADYPIGFKILPDCYKDGSCGLNDFVQLFVNVSHVGVKILPYLTMILMIWAGFNLVMSGGNPEKIQEGKRMISSIALGIIIVTIIAWAYANFVVYVLTGSVKVFPGYIWEKEWWGGGQIAKPTSGFGCCIVNDYGCNDTDMTKDKCNAIWFMYAQGGTSVNYRFQEGQFCSEFKTTCDNLKFGCCVPNNTADKTCFVPNEKGCLDWPATTHDNNDCINLDSLCEDIQGEANWTGNETGCCVTPNKCSTAKYAECSGSFYAGQNCSAVSQCTTGCCVGQKQCASGKINCTGYYNPSECNVPPNAGPNGNCTTGCCTEANKCTSSTTKGWCDQQATGFLETGDVSCRTEGACIGKCCLATCTENITDGACPGDNVDPTQICSFIPQCDVGCCSPAGASSCIANQRRNQCSAPGDQYFAGACPTGAGQTCQTGCCINSSSNYICTDTVVRGSCARPQDSFFGGSACNTISLCRTGGSCTILGVCTNQTSSQTDAYCASRGGTYSTLPCP